MYSATISPSKAAAREFEEDKRWWKAALETVRHRARRRIISTKSPSLGDRTNELQDNRVTAVSEPESATEREKSRDKAQEFETARQKQTSEFDHAGTFSHVDVLCFPLLLLRVHKI